MRKLLREPLLHFLLLGAALFAVYAYRQRGLSGIEPARRIVITPADLRQLTAYFEAQQHREPSPAELNVLVDQKIQEEVLYREAIAAGLDQDDAIVRSRLAEKMRFLAEDDSTAREPTDAELKAWFKMNAGQFAEPGRATFRHLLFSTKKRGPAARGDAEKALEELAREPKDSPAAAKLADEFAFQDYYTDAPLDELSSAFGPQFVTALALVTAGSWQGPIESTHGWHLMYLDALTPPRTPKFEEIEPEIKAAWLEDQKAKAWQKVYANLRAKYSVVLPAAQANVKQPQAPSASEAK